MKKLILQLFSQIHYKQKLLYQIQVINSFIKSIIINQMDAKQEEVYSSIIPKEISLRVIDGIQIDSSALKNTSVYSQFEEQTKKRIQNILNSCTTIQEFLQLQIYKIIDCIQRRCLTNYFSMLINQSNLLTNQMSNLIKSMSFMDFTIFIMKITASNFDVARLLFQQSYPVPIVSMKDKAINNKLIRNILGCQKYPVIINIWSEQAINNLKFFEKNQFHQRIYFCQAINLHYKFFQGSSFQSNINLIKLQLTNQKNILLVNLVNYNKQDDKSLSIKQQLLKKITKVANFIIFNVGNLTPQKQNLENQRNHQTSIIYQNYPFLFEKNIKRIYINQLSTTVKNILIHQLQFFDADLQERIFLFQQNIGSFETENQSIKQDQYIRLLNLLKLQVTQRQSLKQQVNYQTFIIDQSQHYSQSGFQQEYNRLFLLHRLTRDKSTLLPIQKFFQKLKDLRYKINDINIKSLQLEYDQKNKQLLVLQTQLKQLKRQNSQFLSQCIQLMKIEGNNDEIMQNFINNLHQITSKKIVAELQQLKKKYPQQTDQRQQQFKLKKHQIISSRITIDSIIQQISSPYNWPIPIMNFINSYYQKCFTYCNPFKIIDGLSFNYSNDYMKSFFEKMHNRFDRKKLFVISVIGPSNQNKSALLSYLFGYSVKLGQDLFAKGIYMSFCQINNKMIIILTTEGIMQIDFTGYDSLKYNACQKEELFAAFDHLSAAILIKQSDLVIISSSPAKDQQGKVLENMVPYRISLLVGVCYQILQALQVDNTEKQQIVPKNIILTFSDVDAANVDKINLINNLVKSIKPLINLSDESPTSFRKKLQRYIHLADQNIFFLPSLYNNSQRSITKKRSQEYGMRILDLRSRVTTILQEQYTRSRNIIQFYRQFQANWWSILLTCRKIVEVLSVNQLSKKSELQLLYKRFYPNIQETIISLINKRYNQEQKVNSINLQSLQPKLLIDYKGFHRPWFYFQLAFLKNYLKEIKSNQKFRYDLQQDIICLAAKDFKYQAYKQIQKQEWIDEYIQEAKKLFDSILLKKILEYYNIFERKFQSNILNKATAKANYIRNRIKNNQSIESQFRQLIMKIKIKQIEDEVLDLSVDKAIIKVDLKNTFQMVFMLEKVFIDKLKIRHINDCLEFDKETNQERELHKFVFFPCDQIDKNRQIQLSRIIQRSINHLLENIQPMVPNRNRSFDVLTIRKFVKQNIIQVTKRINEQIKEKFQIIQIQKSAQLKRDLILAQQKLLAKMIENSESIKKNDKDLLTLQSEKTYFFKIYQMSQNSRFKQRPRVNGINLKIILIAKMFNQLYELTVSKRERQNNQFRKKIYGCCQQMRQNL